MPSYETHLCRLRNPYGFSDDQLRESRLCAADEIESLRRMLTGQQRGARRNASLAAAIMRAYEQFTKENEDD